MLFREIHRVSGKMIKMPGGCFWSQRREEETILWEVVRYIGVQLPRTHQGKYKTVMAKDLTNLETYPLVPQRKGDKAGD